jgi:hypothetical protein
MSSPLPEPKIAASFEAAILQLVKKASQSSPPQRRKK